MANSLAIFIDYTNQTTCEIFWTEPLSTAAFDEKNWKMIILYPATRASKEKKSCFYAFCEENFRLVYGLSRIC